jgi:hypothetical protein
MFIDALLLSLIHRVWLSSRSWANDGAANGHHGHKPGSPVVFKKPNIKSLGADGSVHFVDGSVVRTVDAIMHCTGYVYRFPFLEGIAGSCPGAPTIDDNRVAPLYKHIFPPSLAPRLAFIGLPWKVVPFPQFELQAQWVARSLTGRAVLPPVEEMMADVETFYAALDAQGVAKRYTHRQEGDVQWEYNRWLAAACGPGEEGLCSLHCLYEVSLFPCFPLIPSTA